MRKIFTTELVIDQEAARKNLDRIIKQMLITRIFKRTYDIEATKLLYVPFAVLEYKIDVAGRTKKAKQMQHLYLSMELGNGVIKPFAEIEALKIIEQELDDESVAYREPNIENIKAAARKELLFKILPKNLKSWKEYDMEMLDIKVVYRPLWIIKYRVFGKKARIYKSFGDSFNL